MSYKELADKLQMLTSSSYADLHEACDEAAAILRSLDTQPVAVYHGRCVIDCGENGHSNIEMLKMIPAGSKLYAAPVAAQPTREQIQRERMGARQWNAKAFDFAGYFAALQRAMHARNATPADVSRATGVSATTLTRMKEGRRPDAASLAALSAWAGLNPAAYVKASPAKVDFDLPAQSDEVAAQPTELEELRKLVKDFPLNDRDVPIIYDTNEIDQIAYALTGDDGEDDSVTVLQRLVRSLSGKTVYNLLEEAEAAAQPQQAKLEPLSDEEIAFCIFESKMKNPAITRDGTTSIRIARAAIAAFCQKNGIKEQG